MKTTPKPAAAQRLPSNAYFLKRDQTYTVAAKSITSKICENDREIPAANWQPVAILVRGTPETALNDLLNKSFLQEAIAFLLAFVVIGIWVVILTKAIIKQIVENIQLGTSEVVRAMEQGMHQVTEGTHLVKDAKSCLGQILDVSRQIDQLVQSISGATVSQAETSVAVANLMQEIAKVCARTADSSRLMSSSVQQTVELARQLQASVGVFKVGTQD